MSAEQQKVPTEMLSKEQKIDIATSQLAKYVDVMGPQFVKLNLEVNQVVNRAAMMATPKDIQESVRKQLEGRMKEKNIYPVAQVVPEVPTAKALPAEQVPTAKTLPREEVRKAYPAPQIRASYDAQGRGQQVEQKPLPIAQPVQEAPVAKPVQEAPVAKPVREEPIPVAKPVEEIPVIKVQRKRPQETQES